MGLVDLPAELLDVILVQLLRPTDLVSLLSTCRGLHAAVVPHFYSKVAFPINSEDNVLQAFANTKNPGLAYIRELEIYDSVLSTSSQRGGALQRLSTIVGSLHKDTLRHFNWNVPLIAMSNLTYAQLLKQQQYIENFQYQALRSRLANTKFLVLGEETVSSEIIFRSDKDRFSELELTAQKKIDYQDIYMFIAIAPESCHLTLNIENGFGPDRQGYSPALLKVIETIYARLPLGALRHLSLDSITIVTEEITANSVSTILSLQSLEISNCIGVDVFFSRVNQVIHDQADKMPTGDLKSFKFRLVTKHLFLLDAIWDFLRVFDGLEHLFIELQCRNAQIIPGREMFLSPALRHLSLLGDRPPRSDAQPRTDHPTASFRNFVASVKQCKRLETLSLSFHLLPFIRNEALVDGAHHYQELLESFSNLCCFVLTGLPRDYGPIEKGRSKSTKAFMMQKFTQDILQRLSSFVPFGNIKLRAIVLVADNDRPTQPRAFIRPEGCGWFKDDGNLNAAEVDPAHLKFEVPAAREMMEWLMLRCTMETF